MSEIIFARPRHPYGSYTDLWRLIQLSGFRLVYFDEMDMDSDNIYIASSPQSDWWTMFEAPHRCRIVWWDIEFYPDLTFDHIEGVDIWTADPAYAKAKGIRFILMGSNPCLAGYHTDETGWVHPTFERIQHKAYDAILLAHMTWRRQVVQGQMVELGLRVAPNENLWGSVRHTVLSQTRAMVHVHQRDDYRAFAPQRFALAAAYKLPLLTETLPCLAPFDHHTALPHDFQGLAQHAHHWLGRNDARILENYGVALHQFLCEEHSFRKTIEAAL